MSTTAADRRALGWLLLAALLVLGAGIGLRDPWPSDEPRFALVAKTMVESGDWLFPRRGSELYPDKPPMLMWLQAASYTLVRDWRVAFLLPSLLAGLGTLVLVWDLARRLWSPRAGLLAAVGVLSALMFSFQFKRAQIDPLVSFEITLACYALARHLLLGPAWRWYWIGCFAAGLGVITKGVGVIALLMLLPYVLVRRAGWQGLLHTQGDGWRWAAGLPAFLAAIALWLVPMVGAALWRGEPEYLDYMRNILFDQTARRYAGQVGGHYGKGWWYFIPVLLLHFFPLSLAYGAGARDAWAGWRARDGRLAVLLGWCALVFLFFSMAGGKREVYVLPMLPMLSVALAPTLLRIENAAWLRRTGLVAALGFGIAFSAAAAWALSGRWARLQATMLERGLHAGELQPIFLWLAAAGAGFLVWAAVFRARRGVHALLAGLAGFWIVWGVGVAPLANHSVTSAEVMQVVDRIAGPQGEVGMVVWKEQNLLMSPRPLHDFGFRQAPDVQFQRGVDWLRAAPANRWLFARHDAVQACLDDSRVTLAGYANRWRWVMFQLDAVKPGCRVPPLDGPATVDETDGA
ncbi:MAG: glycosyltransferase family 39 protein [Rhodoferax sp.]|nr:glycosyltransferase family 39 protein [Rhodoferax sp.]